MLALPGLAVGAENEGTVNSMAHKDVPAGAEIHVRPLDNSDEALAVLEDFKRELKARGYRLNPNAKLVLTFEIRDEIGAFTTTDRRYFVELHARGSRTGGEDAQARFNVFDSRTGGILNRGKGETQIVTPSQYRLDVTIDRQVDDSHLDRLWQGWAVGDLGSSDSETLIRAMVAPLLNTVGKTVRRQTFPLPR